MYYNSFAISGNSRKYREQFERRANAIINYVNKNNGVVVTNGTSYYEILSVSLVDDGDTLKIVYDDDYKNIMYFEARNYRYDYVLKIDREDKTVNIIRRQSWMSDEEFIKCVHN